MKILCIGLAVASAGAAVHAGEPSIPLQSALRTRGTGSIVALDGLDPLTTATIAVDRAVSPGKMIYCGSPEYCPGSGVLYRDTFTTDTDVRLYLYHVNASKRPMRFSIVLEPVGGPAVVDVKNSIVIGPSIDYFSVGRLSSFIQLGRPVPREPRRIRVDGITLLDEDLDRRVCPPGRTEPLVHSLHDLRVVSGTVRVSSVAVEERADTVARFPTLTLLSRDKNHDRGTYDGLTIRLNAIDTYSTADGVRHLRLADGKTDGWLPGGDATLKTDEPYRGAYGVIYRVHLRLASPDGRRVALVLNPRGGGLGGAVSVETPGHGRSTGYTPDLGLGTVNAKEEAVILGKWNPRVTPEVTIVWTPPGAASLPVEWLLIPY
ncbi:MAG TPA: hypothetical protein VGM51_11925 [Armatimonadota bacterium]|jgi:hypothetical protein